jgi:N-carbamoylputrescine amidase
VPIAAMNKFRVALLQMNSVGADQAANMVKGERFCRQAAALDADVALFPEMWNIGYTFPSDDPGAQREWRAQSITTDSDFVAHFRSLARSLNMAIAISYLQAWPDAPRNAVSLIDRHGEIALTYTKVHTCDFGDEALLTPGEEFYVTALDTAAGAVQVGAMICYDREFPESARILMLQGAEIILCPNACTMEIHRIGQFKVRAYENMLGVALTNYAAPQNNGHSVAFDPVVFEDNEGHSRETCVAQAGEAEGVYMATFDLDLIRDFRKREVWGNAYRKPRIYKLLTSNDVRQPFSRPDARR